MRAAKAAPYTTSVPGTGAYAGRTEHDPDEGPPTTPIPSNFRTRAREDSNL